VVVTLSIDGDGWTLVTTSLRLDPQEPRQCVAVAAGKDAATLWARRAREPLGGTA
jgi:hypothetical protein